jgi:hypothetical protein
MSRQPNAVLRHVTQQISIITSLHLDNCISGFTKLTLLRRRTSYKPPISYPQCRFVKFAIKRETIKPTHPHHRHDPNASPAIRTQPQHKEYAKTKQNIRTHHGDPNAKKSRNIDESLLL